MCFVESLSSQIVLFDPSSHYSPVWLPKVTLLFLPDSPKQLRPDPAGICLFPGKPGKETTRKLFYCPLVFVGRTAFWLKCPFRWGSLGQVIPTCPRWLMIHAYWLAVWVKLGFVCRRAAFVFSACFSENPLSFLIRNTLTPFIPRLWRGSAPDNKHAAVPVLFAADRPAAFR